MMDFEGSSTSGVVEYGVVLIRKGEIQETHTSLCRPMGFIGARDREVHGIGDSETREEAPFSRAWDLFVNFRRSGIFAAHNRHAENNFLKATWAVPPEVPDWRGEQVSAQEWGPWIDTLSIYRKVYPGLESYGLGELTDLFGCRDETDRLAAVHCPPGRRNPHCALYDALASALLLTRLEGVEELRGRISLNWLLQMSSEQSSQQELF